MNIDEQSSVVHEQQTKERVKKGTVYIAVISITMMFLGLFSAYVVSAGDSFWIKFPMPSFFWISTAAILVSSLTFEFAIRLMKNGKSDQAKTLVLVTTLLGLFFTYSQFQGYNQLVDKGAYFVNRIMVSNGRYGDYFEIKKGNDLLQVNGNSFMIKDRTLNEQEYADLRAFAGKFAGKTKIESVSIPDYGKSFTILHRFEPLRLENGKFYKADSTELQLADWLRLEELMSHIASGRGDFFISGEYGKDFKMYYAGEELDYKDRQLYYKGKELNRGLQLKLYDSKDNATSYLYIITFLHLLHIIGTLLYMFAFTRRTYANEFSAENTIGMRATSIFWHYLGGLWLILFLFLLFIH
jgi:cytochrome c oxidase subunit 3